MNRNPLNLINGATKWMVDYAKKSNITIWVVGVSGGIDSTVVERLCENTGLPTIAIAMPMWMHKDSDPKSLSRAMALCVDRPAIVNFRIRPIGGILEAYQKAGIGLTTKLSQGNLRSRIRADILRDAAGEVGCGCVVGTGNLDEDAIGYFTKGGDGDVDICPLSLMHKSEVRAMASAFSPSLRVPEDNINAIATAGLWDGQTDEGELGMTYDEIGWAIDHQVLLEDPSVQNDTLVPMTERKQEVLQKVNHMRKVNAHKLAFPPVFDPEA